MNEKFREFIKDLPQELQEKARGIKTQEELTDFLSDNDIELPEDALEAVSGGCGEVKQEYEPGGHIYKGACPDCGGDLIYHDNVWKAGYSARAKCAKTGVLYYRLKSVIDENRHKWLVYQE